MFNYDSDIPKHQKKKKSNSSKSKSKSKHKHEYIDCLLIDEYGKPMKSEYCKLCGKIGNVWFFETVELGNGRRRQMEASEVFEKYKYLEQFKCYGFRQKYVSFNTENI